MTDVVRGSWQLVHAAWRMGRAKLTVAVVLLVAGTVAAPLLAVALARMTNDIVAGRGHDAALAGVAVAGLAIVALTFAHFAHIAYFELSELAELDFDERLIRLSNGSPGIEHHEQAEHADAITVLQQEGKQLRTALEALLNCVGLGLAMLLTGGLLFVMSPVLLLLPLAALPPLVTGRRAERILDRARTATAEPTRVALNLFRQSTSARFAGELRVFGLGDELRARRARLWRTSTRVLWRAHLRATWVRAAGQVVFALAYIGAVLLVLREAIAGRRGVGDVVLVVALAVQVNQQVTTAVTLLQDLQRMASTYRRLAALADVVATADLGDLVPPDRLVHGIAFDGVAFTYPGTEVPVLRDVNLRLPAGATVAIVGENGAGKSTLVKLLCGFYQPSRGRILVDGTDLRRQLSAWRQRIAAGFQDFVRYELLTREAIGVGDLPRLASEPAIRTALDRAGAAEVVDRLPDGLDTQLGKSYADGCEPSGGQWQKLALARALMREAPLLLVLDEPASALDPDAENALFERHAEQAKLLARTTGGITVFVSHRFSTVRTADLIIVVQGGRVTQCGDHTTLLAEGGLYAELYGIQADAYA